jgi:DNA-binding transcriptional ArsR family regulator
VPGPDAASSARPLYEIKANLFKALSHPLRIRTLEILSRATEPTPVSAILTVLDVDPALLSQHLAVLKRHHVVASRRIGNAVYYELAHPKIAELLLIARVFLTDTLAGQRDHYAHLQSLPPIGTG